LAYDHVECIKQQCLSIRAVMLEKVERDSPAFVDGRNLAVEQRIDWQPFIGAGDMGN